MYLQEITQKDTNIKVISFSLTRHIVYQCIGYVSNTSSQFFLLELFPQPLSLVCLTLQEYDNNNIYHVWVYQLHILQTHHFCLLVQLFWLNSQYILSLFQLSSKLQFSKLYKSTFSQNNMKRSSRRWKKKRQMRWKWQRKRLRKEKRKRKQRRARSK